MDNQTYQRAKDKVNAKLVFYLHFAIYLVVNTLLIMVNIWTFPQYLWFRWPLLGWGIGLCFHALAISVFYLETGLKEKLIEWEMRREAAKKK